MGEQLAHVDAAAQRECAECRQEASTLVGACEAQVAEVSAQQQQQRKQVDAQLENHGPVFGLEVCFLKPLGQGCSRRCRRYTRGKSIRSAA